MEDEVKETVKATEEVSNELSEEQLDKIAAGSKTTFTLLAKILGGAADQAAKNR